MVYKQSVSFFVFLLSTFTFVLLDILGGDITEPKDANAQILV